jgi:antitoxin component YwqK of YwqJK toxin-antitoxin module
MIFMSTRSLLSSLIALLFLLSSCNSKTKAEKSNAQETSGKENLMKGKTLLIDTMLGNEKFIFQKAFYENGAVKQTGFYSPDTIMQGKWINYYPNEKVESITNYANGLKDGFFKSYHENGQLWTVTRYSKNKTMDIVSNYDRNGEPQRKGSLKNGYGTIILYDENGEKKGIERYKNGKLVEN